MIGKPRRVSPTVALPACGAPVNGRQWPQEELILNIDNKIFGFGSRRQGKGKGVMVDRSFDDDDDDGDDGDDGDDDDDIDEGQRFLGICGTFGSWHFSWFDAMRLKEQMGRKDDESSS